MRNHVDSLIERLLTDELSASAAIAEHHNALNMTGSLNRTALMAAAGGGRVHAVDLLIKAGASPRVRGEQGLTPLHEAAANGAVHVINQLLVNGAEIDAVSDQGVTPLMCAAAWGEFEAVRSLLENGAYAGLKDSRGCTAADIAEEKGYPEVCLLIGELITRQSCLQ